MVTQNQGPPETEKSQDGSTPQDLDPTNTEHPVGAEQAAENADDESPS